jgi:hypothetical protein
MTTRRALIEELREQVERCENERENELRRTVQIPRHFRDDHQGDMRLATLAVVLMLQNRLDALPISEYAHVKQGNVEQQRIDRLRALLGEVSDEEQAAAVALWEEVAE